MLKYHNKKVERCICLVAIKSAFQSIFKYSNFHHFAAALDAAYLNVEKILSRKSIKFNENFQISNNWIKLSLTSNDVCEWKKFRCRVLHWKSIENHSPWISSFYTSYKCKSFIAQVGHTCKPITLSAPIIRYWAPISDFFRAPNISVWLFLFNSIQLN